MNPFIVGDDQPPDWRLQALCRQYDPDAFFPNSAAGNAEALRICRHCTVREQCLAGALARPADQQHGVRGGTTARQRRALLKERGA